MKINPELWSSVFAVPAKIVDENLKLAGAAQLKVLLWYLRNSGKDPGVERASKELGIHPADISDALLYWYETGVLVKNAGEKSEEKIDSKEREPNGPAREKPAAKPVLAMPQKPTIEEVAKRGAESHEIAYLLNEAQSKFGRVLSHSEVATLIWLHDYGGMPVSVLLMLIGFCVSKNKGNLRYIEKVALDWIDNEIFSIKQAEEKIQSVNSIEKAWFKIESVFRISHRRPTKYEEDFADRVVNEWKFSKDLILKAYEECVNRTGKYSASYINKILEGWHRNGIKTLEDAENKTKKEKPQKTNKVSFDIEEYKKIAKKGPVLRKNDSR